MLLLFGAGLLGMGGAIIGWPPFYAAALVLLIRAAATFFMLPIWAMTRSQPRQPPGWSRPEAVVLSDRAARSPGGAPSAPTRSPPWPSPPSSPS
ncbi:MAG: hypothetical protein R2749_10195 [Acidimicrobiales bacterium]